MRKIKKDTFILDRINNLYRELFKTNFHQDNMQFRLNNLDVNTYCLPEIASQMYSDISNAVTGKMIDTRSEKMRVAHILKTLESGHTRVGPHLYNLLYLLITIFLAIMSPILSKVISNTYFSIIVMLGMCGMMYALIPEYAKSINKESFENSFEHLFYSTYLEILNEKYY